MSQKRLSTWQKATALVPLALLSGAWTVSLAATSSATASAQDTTSTLPDGTVVPDQAIEAPASLSQPGSIAPGVPAGSAQTVAASSTVDGIPSAALAAYRRAEQVINEADPSCNLSWELLAAIGRVESDHGRYGGNVLGEDGRSRPGIFGIALDGSDGTAEIRDSDAGEYDDDQVYDRAVGPMQFIPQTWSVVGVDGDGDGVRDPQDIDDAALASAVYLCSGGEDLSTYGGQRAAVYRYNHSNEYVDLVISIMNAYLDGDFSSVPNAVAPTSVLAPSSGATVRPAGGNQAGDGRRDGRRGDRDGRTPRDGGAQQPVAPTGDDDPAPGPAPSPTPPAPSPKPTSDPVKTVTDKVQETVEVVDEVSQPVTSPVQEPLGGLTSPADKATGGSLSTAEATTRCLASGISRLDVAALDACVAKLTG